MPATKFKYGTGDRPLDGYTIKRGIGQGGFGEVYYALSDAGKEVALKLVRGNSDIEIRGMQQCINLKHPNLVALYDIKTDETDDSWVVMEYVAGDSLAQLMQKAAKGLAENEIQRVFYELSKAMNALHESGIVHRDLKPANVFLEHGMVKVGDYGLSKFISGTQKSPQTQSIGTVHYMAPEISTGNYGKQVDVYAAGVMLYEMLTGKLPFDGESVGEILMKHLTAHADLWQLPERYRPIIAKALAKNPSERFRNFTEFHEAVSGNVAVNLPPGSNEFRPLVAPASNKQGTGNYTPVRSLEETQPYVPNSAAAPLSDRIYELMISLVQVAIWSSVLTILWAFIDRSRSGNMAAVDFMGHLATIVAACWAVIIPAKIWEGKPHDPWMQRGCMFIFGGLVGLLAAYVHPSIYTIVGVATPETRPELQLQPEAWRTFMQFACFYGIAFFVLKWWMLAARFRHHRFSLWSVAWTAFIAYVMMKIWGETMVSSQAIKVHGKGIFAAPVVVLTLASLVIQLVSPWSMPAPKSGRQIRYRLDGK